MEYFSIEELCASDTAKRRGIDNRPTAKVVANLVALVGAVLDPLRRKWGQPLKVNSGYRCPALNRAVGGVAGSQHLKGEAVDITAGSKAKNRKLLKMLLSLNLPFDQVIDEADYKWLHISYKREGSNRYMLLRMRNGRYYPLTEAGI